MVFKAVQAPPSLIPEDPCAAAQQAVAKLEDQVFLKGDDLANDQVLSAKVEAARSASADGLNKDQVLRFVRAQLEQLGRSAIQAAKNGELSDKNPFDVGVGVLSERIEGEKAEMAALTTALEKAKGEQESHCGPAKPHVARFPANK